MDGLSRVWALAEDGSAPVCFVHVSREGIAAGRGTGASEAAPGLRRPHRGLHQGDRTKALVLDALGHMLRELRAVRDLPDDDPRRQAALAAKRRLLDIVESYESA
jgi:hypothetical protein